MPRYIHILVFLFVMPLLAQGQLLIGSDTSVCAPATVLLDAGLAGASYTWSTGQTSQTILVSQSGVYSLTIDDGSSIQTATSSVTVLPQPQVLRADTSLCQGPQSLGLSHSGDEAFWWDDPTGTGLLARGDSLSLLLNADRTVYVESQSREQTTWGGAADNSITGGGGYFLRNGRGLVFNVLSDFILYSCKIYVLSSNGQPVSFDLQLQTSAGTVLQQRSYSVEAGFPQIVIDWPIPTGNGYRLIAANISSNGSFYLNTSMAGRWPLVSPGLLSITGDIPVFNNYNYFYDWELIQGAFCSSGRQPVQLTAVSTPSISLPSDTLSCTGSLSLDVFSSGADYLWSTGATTSTLSLSQSQQVQVTVSRGVCAAQASINAEVLSSPNIIVRDTSVCSGSLQLAVVSDAEQTLWWSAAAGGNLLASGDSITWQADQSMSFFVEGLNFSNPSAFIGLPDNSGHGGAFFLRQDRGLVFDVLSPVFFEAVSLHVRSLDGQPVAMRLRIEDNTGSILWQNNLSLQAGFERVLINTALPVGSNYRLLADQIGSNGELYINTGMAGSYPFTLPALLSITGDIPVFGNYNYFYNWELRSGGFCASSRQELELDVVPSPSIDLPADSLSCQSSLLLDAGNAGANYLWSTGETSQTISPSQAGLYGLTVSQGICSDEAEIDLNFHSPPLVQLRDTITCATSLLLGAQGSADRLYWWADSSRQELLGLGDSLLFPVLDTTSVYVEALSAPGAVYAVGPSSRDFHGGAFFLRNDNRGIEFESFQNLELLSVKLYASGNPQFQVRLFDVTRNRVLQERSYTLSAGEHILRLDWRIREAGIYRLTVSSISGGELYINTELQQVNFPFAQAGVLTLLRDVPSFPLNNYNYFYDWQVAVGGFCAQDLQELRIDVLPTPRIDLPSDTAICGSSLVLDASANNPPATQYLWQDGSTTASITALQSGTWSLTASIASCFVEHELELQATSPPSVLQVPLDTTVCPGLIELQASGDAYTYAWYDRVTGGSPLALGEQVALNLSDSTQLWVEGLAMLLRNEVYAETDQGTSALGEYLRPSQSLLPTRGLLFDALQPFVLERLSVWSDSSFGADIELFDAFGNLLYSQTLSQQGAGEHVLTLNWLIEQGTAYFICLRNVQGGGIWLRNNYSFPLQNSFFRINRSEPLSIASQYSYFFRWRISSPSCPTPRQALDVHIPEFPEILLPADTALCDSSTVLVQAAANNPLYSYLWSDGSTANTRNLSQSGIYAVTVTHAGLCSSLADSRVQLLSRPASPQLLDTVLCSSGPQLLLDERSDVLYTWQNPLGTLDYLGSPRPISLSNSTGFELGLAARAQTRVGPKQVPSNGAYSSILIGSRFDLFDWAILDSLALQADRPCQFDLVLLSSTGNELQREQVQIALAHELQYLPLGWTLAPDLGYELQIQNNIDGASFLIDSQTAYPQGSSAALAEIASASIPNIRYHSFYDWHFSYALPSCAAPATDSFFATIVLPLNLPTSLFACDTAFLDASLPNAQAYAWSTGQTTASIELLQPGLYTVTVSAGACQALAALDLSMPAPIALPQGSVYCGDSLFSPNYNSPSAIFFWSNGETTERIALTGAGTYALELRSPEGCNLFDTAVFTQVVPPPAINLGPDRSACFQTQLDAAYTGPQVSYLWNTGETTQTIEVQNSGFYSLTVAIDNLNCSSSDSLNIGIDSLPTANFTTFTSATPTGYAVGFSNQSINVQGGGYLWVFEDSSSSTFVNPFRTYQDSGCYPVRLIALAFCGSDTLDTLIAVGVDTCLLDVATRPLPELPEARLYPNPNTGHFWLELGRVPASGYRLRIYNSLGQELAAPRMLWQERLRIEQEGLAAGMYFLKLEGAEGQSLWIPWIKQDE